MRVEQVLVYFKRKRDTIQLIEEDLAIWALEKQIPKKLIKDDNNMACPMCGANSCHYCKYRKNCRAILQIRQYGYRYRNF